MSKRALILIDIQNDYFADGKWPRPCKNAASNGNQRPTSFLRVQEAVGGPIRCAR